MNWYYYFFILHLFLLGIFGFGLLSLLFETISNKNNSITYLFQKRNQNIIG